MVAPVPGATEYFNPVSPAQRLIVPVIGEVNNGVEFVGVTLKELAVPTPQPFEAVTVTKPAVAPGVTKIESVPWPEVITQPAGTVHTYPVTPFTEVVVYLVVTLPMQGISVPVIVPDVAGGVLVGVVAKSLAVPAPQPFEAVTDTVPAEVPAVT